MVNEAAIKALAKALKNKTADKFETGDVIRWRSADRFAYAAIKADNGWWYITGNGRWYHSLATVLPGTTSNAFSYEAMLKILNRSDVSDIRVASGWGEIT